MSHKETAYNWNTSTLHICGNIQLQGFTKRACTSSRFTRKAVVMVVIYPRHILKDKDVKFSKARILKRWQSRPAHIKWSLHSFARDFSVNPYLNFPQFSRWGGGKEKKRQKFLGKKETLFKKWQQCMVGMFFSSHSIPSFTPISHTCLSIYV